MFSLKFSFIYFFIIGLPFFLAACGDAAVDEEIPRNQPAASKMHLADLSSSEQKKMGQYLGAKSTEYPDWFKESFLDFKDDIAEAAEQDKRVMIIFHQENCPYCNALVEKNLSQKDIETLLKEKFDVIALNMWGDREVVSVDGQTLTEKSFANALKVQFTPTLLFFDEQANLALRLNGYLPPEKFKLALEYVASKKESEMSFREYTAKHLLKMSNEALTEQAFFKAAPHDLSQSIGKKPVAVFFEQRQCPLCQKLHDGPLKNAEMREMINAFDVIQLDMWSESALTTPDGKPTTAREWAKALNIHYAPSIVLFDMLGSEIIRSEAFFKTFHTQALFHYVLSESYRQESNFQRYLSARAEHLREQGIDVNIWE